MNTKQKRAKNFTADEKMKIVDLITSSGVLISKKTGGPNYMYTSKQKDVAWENILRNLNSNSSSQRSLATLKKAWDNLKRDARSSRAKIRCQNFGTGGGPSVIVEDPLLVKVEAAIGISCSGLDNPFDSNDTPEDLSCEQEPQASTSEWSIESMQPGTIQRESTDSVECVTEQWKLDENATFTLPETLLELSTVEEPLVTVTPVIPTAETSVSVPRKTFKRRLCLKKTAKDSLFNDLQRVAAAKLDTEGSKRVDLKKKAEQIDVQSEILQIQKVHAVLQRELLLSRTAQSQVQLEMIDEERAAKKAKSELELDILRSQRAAEKAKSELELDILRLQRTAIAEKLELELSILRLEREAKKVILKKVQSECESKSPSK